MFFENVGVVIELLGVWKGEMLDMMMIDNGLMCLIFMVFVCGMIGYIIEFMFMIWGYGIINYIFEEFRFCVKV